jgi:DNA polymerase III alpha subunit
MWQAGNIARHVSAHACGYLVTQPVTEYIPIQIPGYETKKEMTQWFSILSMLV